jgi:hypothetical protein
MPSCGQNPRLANTCGMPPGINGRTTWPASLGTSSTPPFRRETRRPSGQRHVQPALAGFSAGRIACATEPKLLIQFSKSDQPPPGGPSVETRVANLELTNSNSFECPNQLGESTVTVQAAFSRFEDAFASRFRKRRRRRQTRRLAPLDRARDRRVEQRERKHVSGAIAAANRIRLTGSLA